ncbi:hypothetical protein, partial [Salmonella enterica]|uniref:hypothetical protein n=1 Tax=Salmonella enterica TaxID=28901 RepID=UPI0020C227ED
RAFKANPKLYSVKYFLDESIVRVVEYNRDEELDAEEESRLKMSKVKYNQPFDYSKLPYISNSFVPQKDKTDTPWVITP